MNQRSEPLSSLEPGLYVVATPIGNLGDMTLRGLETLKASGAVYAEDTRVTRTLFTRYDISVPLRSCREAMSPAAFERVVNEIAALVEAGQAVAFVSDAGTPGISDPGGALVAAVLERGIAVMPVPGASALGALLSVSGLPIFRPLFVGFLPKKKGHQTLMGKLRESLVNEACDAVIFYESPHRIMKLLEEIAAWDLPVRCVLGRELTKKFEEILRGGPQTVAEWLAGRKEIKGEIALLVFAGK